MAYNIFRLQLLGYIVSWHENPRLELRNSKLEFHKWYHKYINVSRLVNIAGDKTTVFTIPLLILMITKL